MSERHRKEFYTCPLLVGIYLSIYLSFERYIGLLPETEIIDIFVKKRLTYFLDYIDHPDITTPVEGMRISVSPDTFIGNVLDLVLVDFYVSFIGIGIRRFDISCIDSDSSGDGLEYGTWFVERADWVRFVDSWTEIILVLVLGNGTIEDFGFGGSPQGNLFLSDQDKYSFF